MQIFILVLNFCYLCVGRYWVRFKADSVKSEYEYYRLYRFKSCRPIHPPIYTFDLTTHELRRWRLYHKGKSRHLNFLQKKQENNIIHSLDFLWRIRQSKKTKDSPPPPLKSEESSPRKTKKRFWHEEKGEEEKAHSPSPGLRKGGRLSGWTMGGGGMLAFVCGGGGRGIIWKSIEKTTPPFFISSQGGCLYTFCTKKLRFPDKKCSILDFLPMQGMYIEECPVEHSIYISNT
jgi:hypothetical protein